jgi:RNA polymerase sigma factor (TIGR02999 family)
METSDGGTRPVTLLLQRMAAGDAAARDAVFAALYRDLRAIAGMVLRNDGRGSVQPTDLLHGAFLKLVDGPRTYATRKHFLDVASLAMRSVLIDHVRAREAKKRGGDLARDPEASAIDRVARSYEERGIALVDLDDALNRLEALDPEAARMATLVLFGGLARGEATAVMGLTERTGARVWGFARARLERWLAAYGPTGDARATA